MKQPFLLFLLFVIDHCVYDAVKGKPHPKGAITKRNRWMVEQADLLVCYVEQDEGGAYAALKYAKKLGKKTINLAIESDDEK